MSNTYQTDIVMEKLFHSLSADMKHCLGITGEMEFCRSALGSRDRKLLCHDGLPPYVFKWFSQLSAILKRYTFQNDTITPKQREELTDAKFIKLQESLGKVYGRERSTRLHRVLTRARFHTRRILDGFSPEDSPELGRFGTKATIGCPASHAYIDEKLLLRPITGSASHLRWLNKAAINDNLLLKILIRNKRGFEVIRKLSQVNVPKKYNIDRGINPNTLAGSLHSDILGQNIVKALKKEGLDIARLQNKHARLVEKISKSSKQKRPVTADLSNASHGFLSHHLNALLPRKWYNACMFGVIREVEIGQKVCRLESIMTMGIGFTFPMQTLLFYCLLLAISDLTEIKGMISVYGDDLIYPYSLHPFVVAIFTEMGFQLNLDKTFVESPFRESCGSDWFKGVDVRPFSPEGSSQSLGKTGYLAFCYKLINGLLLRWDEVEIPQTLALLKAEVLRCCEFVFYVPMHFPAYSGWKVINPQMYASAESQYDCPSITGTLNFGRHTTYSYSYTCVAISAQGRYVTDHSPFYWDWLRQRAKRVALHGADSFTNLPLQIDTPVFSWRPSRDEKYVTLGNGKKVRRREALVTKKGNVSRFEIRLTSVWSPPTEESNFLV